MSLTECEHASWLETQIAKDHFLEKPKWKKTKQANVIVKVTSYIHTCPPKQAEKSFPSHEDQLSFSHLQDRRL